MDFWVWWFLLGTLAGTALAAGWFQHRIAVWRSSSQAWEESAKMLDDEVKELQDELRPPR